MPPPAEPLPCRRCRRPVEISRDQYDVFEQMHYACFHYEFEHDPTDPDEECGAGGCPSAAINPRLDRRPGHEPPRPDIVLAGNWILHSNLHRFLELVSFYVGYTFDESDWLAIQAGLDGLTSDNQAFGYPIISRQQLTLSLSLDPDSGNEVSVTITGRPDQMLAARISGLIDAYQQPGASFSS
jgi:hypothetical protein